MVCRHDKPSGASAVLLVCGCVTLSRCLSETSYKESVRVWWQCSTRFLLLLREDHATAAGTGLPFGPGREFRPYWSSRLGARGGKQVLSEQVRSLLLREQLNVQLLPRSFAGVFGADLEFFSGAYKISRDQSRVVRGSMLWGMIELI